MIEAKYTAGEWMAELGPDGSFDVTTEVDGRYLVLCKRSYWPGRADESHANGELFAASKDLLAEMVRYLPVIDRAEQDPELWSRLTAGTGIATANGYREAIRKTQPNLEVK